LQVAIALRAVANPAQTDGVDRCRIFPENGQGIFERPTATFVATIGQDDEDASTGKIAVPASSQLETIVKGLEENRGVVRRAQGGHALAQAIDVIGEIRDQPALVAEGQDRGPILFAQADHPVFQRLLNESELALAQ
jgi:hypothetical protein